MSEITTREHRAAATNLREMMATYQTSEDLILLGAYAAGSSASLDRAIARHEAVQTFLKQAPDEPTEWDAMQKWLHEVVA